MGEYWEAYKDGCRGGRIHLLAAGEPRSDSDGSQRGIALCGIEGYWVGLNIGLGIPPCKHCERARHTVPASPSEEARDR